MKLREFGVLTNENVHPEVVVFLRAEGFRVATVFDAGLTGAEDVAVLRRARAENRVPFTHDADFGKLAIAAGESVVGVVYLRPGHIQPQFTISSLRLLLGKDPEVVPPFIVVVRRTGERVAIRVRKLA